MMVVLQVTAVVAAVIALVRWCRRGRRVARIEQRFVEAVLAGDFLHADREAAAWFTAVAPRGRLSSAPASNWPSPRTRPPGGAAPGSGLSGGLTLSPRRSGTVRRGELASWRDLRGALVADIGPDLADLGRWGPSVRCLGQLHDSPLPG